MKTSLRARITLGLSSLALALAAVVLVATAALTRLGGAVDTILRENYRSVIACERMIEALERQDSAAQFAAAGREDVARPMLATHRVRFAEALTIETHNVTMAGEGEAAAEIAARYRDYVRAVDETLARDAGAERSARYFSDLLPRFTELEGHVQRVMRMNQASMERADRDARRLARRGVTVTLAVGVLALLAAVWLAWRLPVVLVRPLGPMADAARAVGRGELTVQVPDPEVPELAPWIDAFRTMVERLQAYRQSSLGELLAAKDLANATVQCLLDPVVVFDREGQIALANEAAAGTFGLTVGDELPSAHGDGAAPEEFLRARDEVLRTGAAVSPRNFSAAMRWRDRAGERFFLVRAAPLRADVEGDRRVIVVAQDVTRLRRIDALKSDMVATVSHEFKTPLTSLRMATHLLLEPATGALTEAQREVVTAARDDTERLRALVDALLDLVRIETEAGDLRLAEVDPRRLLEAVEAAHRAVAREQGVALTVEPGAATQTVRVDPEKLGIVLANLVSNAIRHTPSGGRVTLSATDDVGAVRLTVRDTGEGVARDDLTRLVGRARPADHLASAGSGRHGLGLTIAKEIVLQHGGELHADSAVGEGSAFTVVLPRG